MLDNGSRRLCICVHLRSKSFEDAFLYILHGHSEHEIAQVPDSIFKILEINILENSKISMSFHVRFHFLYEKENTITLPTISYAQVRMVAAFLFS